MIYHSLYEAVQKCFGENVSIERTSYVGGGDINTASCLRLTDGTKVFLKSNTPANASFFETEEAGLSAIAATRTIRTPRLFCRGIDSGRGISFLMMEMLPGRRRAPDFWETFGRELAEMHRADASAFVPEGRFGFRQDNFIGATPQINSGRETWIDFFRECRLGPQLRMAARYFDAGAQRMFRRLLERLDCVLTEPERPSLLHGDLWSGNYIVGEDGKAWLIDPAVYVGHREADLAMTELFGGFPPSFYGAYREAYPLDAGYEDRRDLYNLYHLLNHLNLFGPGYLSSVVSTVRQYV